MAYFIACDFDGTVTVRDTLFLIVERFAPHAWQGIEPRLKRGEITLLEAITEEFRHVKTTLPEVLVLARAEAGIREGFVEFVEWAKRGGHRLVIVSAGFRSLIEPLLADAGVLGLEVHAGEAEFTLEGTSVCFTETAGECSEGCGSCKGDTVRDLASPDAVIVHIGDGFSDLCASRQADVVFARGSLARLLEREAIPYHDFETFFDVMAVLSANTSAEVNTSSP
jgi:2,3-diketo-5-methylthio-1-phosphopentane phosphatase